MTLSTDESTERVSDGFSGSAALLAVEEPGAWRNFNFKLSADDVEGIWEAAMGAIAGVGATLIKLLLIESGTFEDGGNLPSEK
uniref:Uncharacterized protein n=1 Tax=Romanomermis culicivorax TaxID=13658 RepID=A0A915JGC7_ROMCU